MSTNNKKNKLKSTEELDTFYYHEALDRTHMLNTIIEDHLSNHPVYKKHSILKEKIEEITTSLSELYIIIGHMNHEKDDVG